MTAVLFDWDGAAADSAHIYLKAYVSLCREYGKRSPVNDIASFRRWYNPVWEQNYIDIGFSEKEIPEALKATFKYVDYTDVSLFPSMQQTIQTLYNQGISLAIVSCTPKEIIDAKLKEFKLDKYFKIVSGKGESSSKEDRVGQIMKSLRCSSGVMIGDTHSDIKAGKANHLKTIACAYGWIDAERLKTAEADYTAEAPEQLLPLIQKAINDIR